MKKGILLILLSVYLNCFSQTNIQDSLALVDLYWATDGANWTHNTNWLSSNVGMWYGITKFSYPYDTTRIVRILLNNNNLNGNIPLSIGNLDYATNIYLNNNNITGSIPHTIGRMYNLKLFGINNNQLTGSLTDSICRLINLNSFDISNNNFTGNIPDSITQLQFLNVLYIQHNQFDYLPDFSGMPCASYANIYIHNNKFTFDDLEPNIVLNIFSCSSCVQYYAPQFDSVNSLIDTTIFLDSSITMLCSIGGQHNIYQWSKDGVDIPFATDSILTLNSVAFADSGVYSCTITNSIVPGLDFHRRPITVHVAKDVGVNSLQYNDEITVYPNPTTGILNIEFGNEVTEIVKFKLYNILGVLVNNIVEEVLKDSKTLLDINRLPSGIYMLKIETRNKVYDYKIIKN